MAWLLDTNLLLRFCDTNSPAHAPALRAVQRLFERNEPMHLTAQNFTEFWSVATRSLEFNGFGWTPEMTRHQIGQFQSQFLFLPDSSEIFPRWLHLVSSLAIKGRKVHDARLVAVMEIHRVTHLLTFNTGDFKIFPNLLLVHPDEILETK